MNWLSASISLAGDFRIILGRQRARLFKLGNLGAHAEFGHLTHGVVKVEGKSGGFAVAALATIASSREYARLCLLCQTLLCSV